MPSKKLSFFNENRNCLLAREAVGAFGYWERLKGLLGTTSLESGAGLYLSPCNQIHMFGMKYALDAVFIDKDSRIVGICKELAPGKISSIYLSAVGCLELPAGTICNTGTEVGDRLLVKEL